jgi:hypothetical protein
MREVKPGVSDFVNEPGAFNPESGIAERFLRHVFEGNAVYPFLIEVVHVFPVALTIRNHIESEARLVARRPANIRVYFLLFPGGPFHGILNTLATRITPNNGVSELLGHGLVLSVVDDWLILNRENLINKSGRV